ncbi:hypothetical protein BJX63DRAFT_415226 [Aspergillus granulosus]|uniref:Uncharacterized protein n=1 Tax=Aspergillus granulosus TaxID=176169 RepID=A0ABR4GU37_9EURO
MEDHQCSACRPIPNVGAGQNATGIRQRDRILHDMNMHIVSIASSFKTSQLDGTNVLLLIPQKTKQQMRKVRRQIEPPVIVDGRTMIVAIPGTTLRIDSWD